MSDEGARPKGRPKGTIKQVNISLDALRAVGLDVQPHKDYPNEWFVNGTIGPFRTPEEAVIKGVKWIYELFEGYERSEKELVKQLSRL